MTVYFSVPRTVDVDINAAREQVTVQFGRVSPNSEYRYPSNFPDPKAPQFDSDGCVLIRLPWGDDLCLPVEYLRGWLAGHAAWEQGFG